MVLQHVKEITNNYDICFAAVDEQNSSVIEKF